MKTTWPIFTIFLLCSSAVIANLDVSNHVYYVLPYGKTNSSCPSDNKDDCHHLSYFDSHYFKSNTTLAFLEGEHLLEKEIFVSNVSQLFILTIAKQSHIYATIVCVNEHGGFQFWYSEQIKIVGIKIINCTGKRGSRSSALIFYGISKLSLTILSIENSSSLGLLSYNVKALHMESCYFAGNGMGNVGGGNILLVSMVPQTIECIITNTSIRYGFGERGGLNIEFFDSIGLSLTIDNIFAHHNLAFGPGGNINIGITNCSVYKILLNNITTTNGISIQVKKQHMPSSGAGLSLFLTQVTCLPYTRIIMSDCKVSKNFANMSSGVGIVLNKVYSCLLNITDNYIFSNGINWLTDAHTELPIAYGGGGLGISSWKNSVNNNIRLSKNYFGRNAALRGGAFVYNGVCGTDVTIIDSIFEGNYGYIGSAIAFLTTSLSPLKCNKVLHLRLVNVSSIGNMASAKLVHNGTTLKYISSSISVFTNILLDFQVQNITIRNNYNMSGMSIYGCNIIFMGSKNEIINNNSPVAGGGLIITSSNSFIVNQGSHVLFANNTAVADGGAIYVKENNNDDEYVLFLNSNEFSSCSFKTNKTSQTSTFNPLVTFRGNKAFLGGGDDFYGGILNYCSINSARTLHCYDITCSIEEYWSLSNERSISSSPIAVCACTGNLDTSYYNCSARKLVRKIYPGQFFNLSLVSVGMYEGIIEGTLVSAIDNGNLIPTTDDQQTIRECKQFTYSVTPSTFEKNSLLKIGVARTKLAHWKELEIYIQYFDCPNGFIFKPNSKCVCNKAIQGSSIFIVCDINSLPYHFKRSGKNWVGYYNEYNCTVTHKYCPFDYCNPSLLSFNISSPHQQCYMNRTGILCGHCHSGFSLMLGSNKCAVCSNTYLSLVPAFIAAGVFLIIFLMLFDLTVSSGRINGIIFYANIVKLNDLHHHSSIPFLTQFISWLNLDLGIETCFYDGLDGYWKTWLQFVFPIYLWLLALLIIFACRHSIKLSRYCGKNAVPVLATVLLMTYTKILRNITNALMYTSLSCKGEKTHHWVLWSVDPSISYFSSKHIILFTVSILLLIMSLAYTMSLFSSQWIERYSYKCFRKSSRFDPAVRLKPLIDAYNGPYKDKCRYWTGFLMIVRVLLTGVFTITTGMLPQLNNIIIIGCILMLISLAWMTGGVYKTKRMNLLELVSYLNVVFICLGTQITSKSFFVGLSFSFCLLLLFAVTISTCFFGKKRLCCNKKVAIFNTKNNSANQYESIGSPANIVMRRESLIFDFVN